MARVMAHLLAGSPAPLEYVELILCREWRCTPAEVRRQPLEDVYNTLTMLAAEGKASRR